LVLTRLLNEYTKSFKEIENYGNILFILGLLEGEGFNESINMGFSGRFDFSGILIMPLELR